MKRVVITGMGPISSMGIGCSETWNAIMAKRMSITKEKYSLDGELWDEYHLHKIREFNIDKFNLPKENFNFIREMRTVKKEDADLYYFLAVTKLALQDSGLQYSNEKNEIGIIITEENPGVETFFEELIDMSYLLLKKYGGNRVTKLELAKALYDGGCESRGYNLQTFSYLFSVAKVFDLHGYSLYINNACASGLFAIEAASHRIRSGLSPAIVVAAIDNPIKIYKYLWFKKYGLYASDGLSKPFSKDANGIVFGDGGAALVLEEFEHAKNRGAKIYAEYLGGGFSLEGWKVTVPDVSNDFYIKSFKQALETSNIKTEDIDFINPHGVGIKVTDGYESRAINRVFGTKKPMISAFKPLVGHNLGGSALLETAISLLSLSHNTIPPTLNCENLDDSLNITIVREEVKKEINVIAKMACGFAGFNGVGIFKKLT